MNIKKHLTEHKELLVYTFWGIATTAINYIVYFACTKLFHMNYIASNLISWFAAVMFAFFANKLLVFKSVSWQWRVVFGEMWKFLSARILSGALETALLFIAVDLLNFEDAPVKILIGILVVLLNYIISKLMIFRTPTE